MAINQDDFITPITGNVVIQNNGARLVLQANADLNTLFEGDESFKLVLRKGSNTGPVVATTAVVIVRDTSNTIAYDSLVESADTIAEGDTITFILDTTNLGPNNTLYYNTVGNAESSLFATGNTGSFLTTGNAYTLSLATTATIPDNETRFFQLEIREGSPSGPIKITSNVIGIVDSLQAFVQATGGLVLIQDDYKIHVFDSSNTFAVSGLGLPSLRSIDYLIVAGGGGGGTDGGGAGAGGLRLGNLSIAAGESVVIAVGGGGASGNQPDPPGSNRFGRSGGNSSISSVFTCVGGGGGGGYFSAPQINGGSGGGNGYGHLPGTGIAGQGNPGGGFWNGSHPNGGPWRFGGGGGAGGIGGIRPATTGNAVGGLGIALNFLGSGDTVYAAGGWGIENFSVPSAATLPAGTGNGYGGNTTCRGASGIVMIRYPYTLRSYALLDNLIQPNAIAQGSNILYNLRTINVPNNTSLYYTTSGNVTASDFFGGNTGSITVVNSNATFSINVSNNIVTGGDTKAFSIQIRENSISGTILTTSDTVTIYSQDPVNYMQATGGTITSTDEYTIHTFTSSDTFTITNSGVFNTMEYLIIGGGGSGGLANGPFGAGGGGAGGYVLGTPVSGPLAPGISFNVIVGAGGTSSAPTGALNGSNSWIEFPPSLVNGGTKIASGGGAGGYGTAPGQLVGYPGGSGGGGGGTGPNLAGGLSTTGQGNSGGLGGFGPNSYHGGGGGGAGGVGGNMNPVPNPAVGGSGVGGAGGSGLPSTISGTNVTRGGGGGGGAYGSTGQSGLAGPGGGGSSRNPAPSGLRVGQQNTGGGGAGGSSGEPLGYDGGSGIVIIRYIKP